jgi:FAD/FMN-containing dehydrogenase
LDERRIRFERRVGRIGFMGRGSRIPARRGPSDAPHGIALRIGNEKVSTSLKDTEAARHEVAPLPGFLARAFSRSPEAVVRPAVAQDAADAVGICFEERTRVVPRGAGTGGLGGAVPVRGGVVIDLKGLGGLAGVDREAGTATFEAGTVWSEVIETLAREGFAPLVYPSSAAAATVGGWASSGGYGVGSLKHGTFHSHIKRLMVGLPSGFLVEATGGEGRYSIPSFAGTEGQIGIVTEATFAIGRAPERRVTYVIRVPGLDHGLDLYGRLAALEPPPDSVDLFSKAAAAQFGEGWDAPVIVVTAEGRASGVRSVESGLRDMTAGSGGEIDESQEARALFRTRFSALTGVEGRAPSYRGSVLLETAGIGKLTSRLSGLPGGCPALEFRAVTRGTTLVTAACGAGGDGPGSIKAFARVRGLVAAGARLRGVPYGAGIWNSPYINVILGGRRKELRRIKGEVDRLRIMNPGKFFSITTRSGLPVPGWALRAYLAMAGRS